MRSDHVKTPAFWSVGCPVRMRFKRLAGLLSSLYNVTLEVPNVSSVPDLSALKEFCGGLLDGSNHLWRGAIRHLSSDRRRSVAMSLFLFRKALPSSKPDVDEYVRRMSQEDDLPDGDFLAFAQRKVGEMFPRGWDRTLYPTAALNAVLPGSASRLYTRKEGGCRSEGLNGGSPHWSDHASYVEAVLAGENSVSLNSSRVTSVETGGKHRIVSIADVDMNILRPMHTAIYNRLSRFDWLLRGDAKPSRFKGFRSVPGELYYSGDYESATDNLNLTLQSVILQRILRGTTQVPDSVKSLALSSQSMIMEGPGLMARQRRGQLMGNLLSFPLLCIVNYLGFLWYTGDIRGRLPVKINGDDIVFRAPPEQGERWMKGVQGAGLTLSVGKTMVDSRYFSLNSSLFKGGEKGVTMIKIVRSTAFGLRQERGLVESLSGRWRQILRDFPCGRKQKIVLGTAFLTWNSKLIVASRRSITRGLELCIPHEAICLSGLWPRECFYLGMPKEVPIPLSPEQRSKLRIPPGWQTRRVENITEEIKVKQREIGPEFVSLAWTKGDPEVESAFVANYEKWKQDVALSGATWKAPTRSQNRRRGKLLKLSVANTKRFLKPGVLRDRWVTDPYEVTRIFKPIGKRVWLPTDFQLSHGSVKLINMVRDDEEGVETPPVVMPARYSIVFRSGTEVAQAFP